MKAFKYLLILLILASCTTEPKGKHLFILSGQSNMDGLIPEESFSPLVEQAFGKEEVIVVKNSYSGQPIRRWFKDWEDPKESGITAEADLYDSLMQKVQAAMGIEKTGTITLVWMQGERDARELVGAEYERSLLGLHQQLQDDLMSENINFVIGRLSDFDLTNTNYPHWTMVREIQVKVADSNPRFTWVDTDDLNDGVNRAGKEISDDLHLSVEGYRILGERFAQKSIDLIRTND